MADPARILLVDDHPIVLEGLGHLLEAQPDMTVVGACLDADEAIRVARLERPDIIVLDLRLRAGSGLAVLRALRDDALVLPRVVVVTARLAQGELVEAVQLGVCAVVLKETAPRELVDVIRRVHQGERVFQDSAITTALGTAEPAATGALPADLPALSPREREIVALATAGHRNREIATRLGLTEGTVKVHLHNVYEKLGVRTRVELTNAVRAHRLI